MSADRDDLLAAVVAAASARGREEKTRARALAAAGESALIDNYDRLPPKTQQAAAAMASELSTQGVKLLSLTDRQYPDRLLLVRTPPPFLFVWGNEKLLSAPAVGICGSRRASDRGLQCARTLGRAIGSQGLTVVSGYAKGVDTESHLGALEAGGSTVMVLAEGISRFRIKAAFRSEGLDDQRTAVVSQFAPGQPWSASAAMTRNGLIIGLSNALVVVEAAAQGGTINAAKLGLSRRQDVFVIDYRNDLPDGNRLLLDQGARPIREQRDLKILLDGLAADESGLQQLELGL